MSARAFPPPLSELDPSRPGSIEAFGQKAVGKTARQIIIARDAAHPMLRVGRKATKGDLGDAMELYYGIKKNSRSDPDFPLAGVELKTLPLKRVRGEGLTVKEPTSISMIHYPTLPTEVWSGASVRNKLSRVLFAVFTIEPDDVLSSTLKALFLWEPTLKDWNLFGGDWEDTRRIVAASKAETLSERTAQVLAARRKGRGGSKDHGTPQYNPRNDPAVPNAPSRAWALKMDFTRQLYNERVLSPPGTYTSIYDVVPPGPAGRILEPAEHRILEGLRPFEGQPLREMVAARELGAGEGKDLTARMVHKALGVKRRKRIREFEQVGYRIRTLNLRSSDGYPFEAVSLPVMDLEEFASEEWEGKVVVDDTDREIGDVPESRLARDLRRILFVPTYSPVRSTPQLDRVLGRPFFWSPSETELQGIRSEWESYQREVREGKAAYLSVPGKNQRMNSLTRPKPEGYIHMRPHAQDSRDVYKHGPFAGITKYCFWLNKEFVYRLVKENNALPPGAVPKEKAS